MDSFHDMQRDIGRSDARFDAPSFFRSKSEMDREQAEFDARSLKLHEDKQARSDYVVEPAMNDAEMWDLIDEMVQLVPHISHTSVSEEKLLGIAKQMFEKLRSKSFEHCSGEF